MCKNYLQIFNFCKPPLPAQMLSEWYVSANKKKCFPHILLMLTKQKICKTIKNNFFRCLRSKATDKITQNQICFSIFVYVIWSSSLLLVSQLSTPWGVLLAWGRLPSSNKWYIASTDKACLEWDSNLQPRECLLEFDTH